MNLKFLLLPAMLFFAGCSTDNINMSNLNFSDKKQITQKENGICKQEPSWVLNPPVENNAIYGVGIAPINFKGVQAQRKSAIAKALSEIATQFNTTVDSQLVTKASLHNGSASTDMDSLSFQTVSGQKVSATIIKSCKNPSSGYFYVLMKARK